MAKKEIEYLSVLGYAKLIGVNEKAVRKAIQSGIIKKGYDLERKKIIRHLADAEYGFKHITPKAGPGISKAKLADKITAVEKSESEGKVRTFKDVFGDENISPSKKVKKGVEKSEPKDDTGPDLSQLGNDELLTMLRVTAGMTYQDAVKYNEIIGLALNKKKLEQMEAILIRKDVVESTLFTVATKLKEALLSIPARVTDEMMTAATKVEAMNVLTSEITEVLKSYAELEGVKFN